MPVQNPRAPLMLGAFVKALLHFRRVDARSKSPSSFDAGRLCEGPLAFPPSAARVLTQGLPT